MLRDLENKSTIKFKKKWNKKKHLEKMKKLGINNKSKGDEIPKQKKTSEFFIKS